MDQQATKYLHEHKINSIFEHLLTVLLLDRPTNAREYLVDELKKLQQHNAEQERKTFLPAITPRLLHTTSKQPQTTAAATTTTKSSTFITSTPLPLLSGLSISSPSLPTPVSTPKGIVSSLFPQSPRHDNSAHSSPRTTTSPTPRTRTSKPLTPLVTHSPRASTHPHDSPVTPKTPSKQLTPLTAHSPRDSTHAHDPPVTPKTANKLTPRDQTHSHDSPATPKATNKPKTPRIQNSPLLFHAPANLQPPQSPFSNSLAPSPPSPSLTPSKSLRKGLANSLQHIDSNLSQPSPRPEPQSRPSTSILPTRTHAPLFIPEIKHTSHITRDQTEQGQRTVNQYILLHHIGRGSYGVVKSAMDSESRQSYAVKILRKSRLRKIRTVMPGKIEDGLQNVKYPYFSLMKKLHHPNIVRLYEVLDDPSFDKLFMVLEYVQLGPVMELEAGKTINPIEPDKAWIHFRDIIRGLDYLHTQKVIHRDIKPENLLIAADGTLKYNKISDFGVSYMFEGDDDALRKTSGTPAFLAPEICSGTKEYFSGRAVDIWAVGVTLYCFIFGRVPFMARTIMQIYEKITSEEVVYDFAVDPLLEGLLNGLLDKNPNTRITMEEIKTHPWVTKNGECPIIDEPEPVEVSEHEVATSIRQISSISSILKAKQLARKMSLHTRRFSVPDGSSEFPSASLQEMMASAYAAAGLGLNVNYKRGSPSEEMAPSRPALETIYSPRDIEGPIS